MKPQPQPYDSNDPWPNLFSFDRWLFPPPLSLRFGGAKPLPRPELEFSLGKSYGFQAMHGYGTTGFKLDVV